MHAIPTTYHGNTAGTRLMAAILALAGSAATIGGNLGIVQYYETNANTRIAQSMTASRGDVSTHIARNKCSSNAT